MKILILLMFVFPPILTLAQSLPDAPKPKIFNAETVMELEMTAGSFAADAMSTQKLYEFPGAFRETNPIARPFVRSRAGDAAYFGAAFSLDVYGTYWLRKHRHPWIARTLNCGLAAWETHVAARNYQKVENSEFEFLLHHPGTTRF